MISAITAIQKVKGSQCAPYSWKILINVHKPLPMIDFVSQYKIHIMFTVTTPKSFKCECKKLS